MTQEDLDRLSTDSAKDEFYSPAGGGYIPHQIGYQAGFKKALELVLHSTYLAHGYINTDELLKDLR